MGSWTIVKVTGHHNLRFDRFPPFFLSFLILISCGFQCRFRFRFPCRLFTRDIGTVCARGSADSRGAVARHRHSIPSHDVSFCFVSLSSSSPLRLRHSFASRPREEPIASAVDSIETWPEVSPRLLHVPPLPWTEYPSWILPSYSRFRCRVRGGIELLVLPHHPTQSSR